MRLINLSDLTFFTNKDVQKLKDVFKQIYSITVDQHLEVIIC